MNFVVFSLPRSRSTWLSRFLECKHDLGLRASSVEDLIDKCDACEGTVETGTVIGWRELLGVFPQIKVVVVRRELIEVCRSLEAKGIIPNLLDLGRKNYQLDLVSLEPGVMSVKFESLNRLEVCGAIYQHCKGRPMELGWWEQLAPINVQPNIGELLEISINNATNLACMKGNIFRDPERLLEEEVTFTEEPLAVVWPEGIQLAVKHYQEVEPESPRKFAPDLEMFLRMWNAGHLLILAARRKGVLIGYMIWKLGFDMESWGNLMAEQGPWFVEKKEFGVGKELFERSIEKLKEASVKYIFPHHRLLGRGKELGKFFVSQGMEEIQHTYYKWIG